MTMKTKRGRHDTCLSIIISYVCAMVCQIEDQFVGWRVRSGGKGRERKGGLVSYKYKME